MQPFEHLEAVALPLTRANIDTDQIIPARFLQKPRINDFGAYLFRDLRFNKDDSKRPEFVLNQPDYVASKIVVAQRNFGCGSSREQAVWALYDYGVRAVLAPSFGDIFYSNSLKNGLLPIVLPAEVIDAVLSVLTSQPGAKITVDLERQVVRAPGIAEQSFDIAPFSKHCLLTGMDELDYTLTHADKIAEFVRKYEANPYA
jgi:3-isopropylmalate/(R)-2-methylmalate dehydratase small subunit